MDLPAPILTYFNAEPPQDSEVFSGAFIPDAIVHDEGQTYHGLTEIRTWWQAAKEKYHHRAEPLELIEVAGKSVVRASVSGDFPGSPAVLTYKFGLSGQRITDLEIGS